MKIQIQISSFSLNHLKNKRIYCKYNSEKNSPKRIMMSQYLKNRTVPAAKRESSYEDLFTRILYILSYELKFPY